MQRSFLSPSRSVKWLMTAAVAVICLVIGAMAGSGTHHEDSPDSDAYFTKQREADLEHLARIMIADDKIQPGSKLYHPGPGMMRKAMREQSVWSMDGFFPTNLSERLELALTTNRLDSVRVYGPQGKVVYSYYDLDARSWYDYCYVVNHEAFKPRPDSYTKRLGTNWFLSVW